MVVLALLGVLACGDKDSGLLAGEPSSYGHASACLGHDSDDFTELSGDYREYTVTGEVIADGVFLDPPHPINACYDMKRALLIRDADGVTWTLGYAQEFIDIAVGDRAVDVTAPLDVSAGRPIELTFIHLADSISNGFILRDDAGLIAAQEYGVDGSALRYDEVPVAADFDVQGGAILLSNDFGCGFLNYNEQDFYADDALSLSTGEAGTLTVAGVAMTATNWLDVDMIGSGGICSAIGDYRIWSVWR